MTEISTAKHQHALVIGKFYPPHRGHMHLIRAAMDAAEIVTVLVYGSTGQKIDVNDRVEWICREVSTWPQSDLAHVYVYPVINDVYEDYNSETIWEAHDHILKAKLRQVYRHRTVGGDVDLIVSSEPYGQEMAEKYFDGIDFLLVDQDRTEVPFSGTKAREDLFGNWEFLPEPTREGLIPRVIFVGAESTGTTTLSKAVADHYGARWAPEYGREYTEEWLAALQDADPSKTVDDLVWRAPDFERIGKRQNLLENRAARKLSGFPLVVGDTDALATAIWAGRYIGNLDESQPWKYYTGYPYAEYQLPRRDFYIVTDHVGVPFVQDGIRDGEHLRPAMTKWFEDALTERDYPWATLRGTHEERLEVAINIIDKIITRRLDFR